MSCLSYASLCLHLLWAWQPVALSAPASVAWNKVPHHTVSGLSAGASMAVNHLVAFSNITDGAAVVAGSPYGCNIVEADDTDFCGEGGWPTNATLARELDESVDQYMHKRAADGLIAPLSSLKGRRVYLYSGLYDNVVNQSAMRALSRQITPFTGDASILHDFDVPSCHGWIVDGTNCGPGKPGSNTSVCSTCCCDDNVLTACNGHDLSGRMFHHLLDRPSNVPKGEIVHSNLFNFSQARYVPTNHSLGNTSLNNTGLWTTGYVYAPKGCRHGVDAKCSVHVHYHGCAWGVEAIGESMLYRFGLMEWAEVMNIILVFPQASFRIDDWGCWDWTGEVSPVFDTTKGSQLGLVMNVLADLPRILSEADSETALV